MQSTASQDLAGPIAGLPAKEYADAEPVMKALIEAGPARIALLIAATGEEFGAQEGVQPKYAVHGLVHYASRPGADAERKMVAETLAATLKDKHSADLKAFVCRQLQFCGGADQVPALAALLADDELCEPAAQALGAIGGPPAAAALREALPKAQGKRRTTLINALGRLRDKGAADEVRKSLTAADADQRIVAAFAAGNAGDAAAIDALLKAIGGEPSYERTQAFDACLRLARRLAESGDAAAAEKLLQQLAAKRKAPEDWHDRCAVLEGLAATQGAKAAPALLEALASGDLRTRIAAGRIALDWAKAVQKSVPAEAEKVLRKLQEATKEEVVLQSAAALLGKSSQ